ncbi:bifunctional UDP-N-acetylglucosamine diphosphorylase/glucosamine-1-phosphate N-acetyltransferase GlmU [Synechococcus sp. UW140]|uniref:bifunctional UDP-N-acetylglucosamine diphosphorylase/glucosamine-1-phosphate N-acetyltransferase GlmU n=1 Tax=Synechococcus sp. UW140 TaxID=368503 RepID=UPI000E0E3D78|nr:bifunctional UDP-N-acetylglucosamine diphosphorylase/glucosamine-1-phosphate N-acetyltransferase GlmU [Synechococcus sp. UW140]
MLAVAVLAAGKGTRMKSALPKVLQPLAGATLVERVLASARNLSPDRKLLIVGHQAERVEEQLSQLDGLEFVLQQPQNGTGHAVQQLLPALKDFNGELLVLNGDVPLLRAETIDQLVNTHRSSGADVTLLTARLDDPTGYGRVFADASGRVSGIIEHRDCSTEQQANNLTNAGIYCFNWTTLAAMLPKLSTDNDQGELYLTDTVAMLDTAMHVEVADPDEVNGINNRKQLAQCEAVLQERLREYWMNEGVTFTDPSSCTLSEHCSFGTDVVIEPQTHLRGRCTIGAGCRIGPGSLLENTTLGNQVSVLMSVVRDTQVGDDVAVGPYSHLRPGSDIGDNCRIGNFVEVKKSRLNSGSKVNHLSYIGDAQLGSGVNVGAGTITANYDGVNKHQTILGDGSKTGANSVLVAPVTIGSNVTIGAGSTITKNVPDNSLALGRAKQLIKENWS